MGLRLAGGQGMTILRVAAASAQIQLRERESAQFGRWDEKRQRVEGAEAL